MTKPRKEKVLHTRVPAVLEQELKRVAEALRVPVSNVVRTILEDAVDRVDAVGLAAEGELRSVAERLEKGRQRLRRPAAPIVDAEVSEPPLSGVVGYQHLLLARDERCTLCGAALRAGDRAYLGVRESVGPRVIIDEACLPISAANTAKQEE